MSAIKVDLTCKPCEGSGYFVCKWPGCEQRHPQKMCLECHGRGRRRPELHEWDALVADRDFQNALVHQLFRAWRKRWKERDRYRQALESIADMVDGHHEGAYQAARAALDSDLDLAERT